MSFKIEKNVPMPTEARGRNGKYPWPNMQVGDSVVVDYTAKQASYKYAIYHGLTFTARRQDDGNYRVWRVK